MANINLLPPDLASKKSVIKLAGILTKVSYTLIAFFLILVLTFLAIFIIDSTKIKEYEAEQTSLIKSIKEHEQTEQQIVLAKDRMSIIKEIWKVSNVNSSLESFKQVLSFTDNDVLIRNAEFNLDKSEISLDARSVNSVAKFMGNLVTSGIYDSIILKNFSFNSTYGYRISFQGNLK